MIRSFLQKLNPQSGYPPPAPGQNVLVVGDIHGRIDLLDRFPVIAGSDRLVCVGDYIDRGDHSADVLLVLQNLPEAICLMGNHEEMLLKFLDDPTKYGPRWLRYGGLQTLASFGIGAIAETADADMLKKAAEALADAMGPDLLAWLRALPSYWQSGNVAITHAGADPAQPINTQDVRHLRWGHPDFEKVPRSDGLWVVHGHTIVDAPTMANGRINVDTGAYATGRLTAAMITDTDVTFHTIT